LLTSIYYIGGQVTFPPVIYVPLIPEAGRLHKFWSSGPDDHFICCALSGIRGTYKHEQNFYSFINAGQSKIYFNFTIKY